MHQRTLSSFIGVFLLVVLTREVTLSSEALVKSANREGRLVIYGTTQLEHMDAMIQGFNKKYPAIKAEYLRQGRTAVYERIIREQKAGVFNADIYGGVAGIQGWQLAQRGLLERYASPERKAVGDDLKDKDGYWTALYTQSYVVAYNTTQVSPNDAPRSYDDILSSKWTGKMGMDEEDFEWYAGYD